MEISVTILDLLIKLCDIRKKLRWQIRCNYIDQEGQAIFNILLYDIASNIQKGKISFHQQTNQVVMCRYSGFDGDKPENLIDLLLDLINYEKNLNTQSI